MTHSSAVLDAIAREVAHGTTPIEGVIAAGQPTPDQLRRLARAGVRTVIDLRLQHEARGFAEPETVEQCGMEYINLPVPLDGVDRPTFESFRKLLRDLTRRPTLVHGETAGRVGALLFPVLVLDEQHASEQALELARSVGLRDTRLARAAFTYVAENLGETG